MGDERAHLDISFEIFRKKYKHSMSINYHPNESGVDRRVLELFETWYDEARADWERVINEDRREQEDAEKERLERAEFYRLKAKYEPPE